MSKCYKSVVISSLVEINDVLLSESLIISISSVTFSFCIDVCESALYIDEFLSSISDNNRYKTRTSIAFATAGTTTIIKNNIPADSHVNIANSAGNHKMELYNNVEYTPTFNDSLKSNLAITSDANFLTSINGIFILAIFENIQNIIIPIIIGITAINNTASITSSLKLIISEYDINDFFCEYTNNVHNDLSTTLIITHANDCHITGAVATDNVANINNAQIANITSIQME
mmetsp:Transcript_25236/g.22069  ORF Transcript_25236/g.22069 Transcript_25236/m.22069 type:complete len:231 (+) Transcript_25236:290-982(+)